MVIDVVVEAADRLLAFIRNRHAGVPLIGHGEKRVQAHITADGKQLRLPRIVVSQTQAEEIANRRFHTRGGLAIPIDAQHDTFQVVGLIARDGKPEVRNLAGPIGVEHGEGCAGLNSTRIRIGAGWVGA